MRSLLLLGLAAGLALFAARGFGAEPAAPKASPVLTQDQAGPRPGQPAPTFRLNDHNGNATSVGGPREDGRWTVLAFYPKALTPG